MNTIDLIKVDIDTRKIQLPSDFSLGVVNDNSCRKIGFIVSKKSDTTDISDLTFRINTLSARGTPDILECEVNDDNDNFIITSELKGTLFECSGTAVINLCGIKCDKDNNIVKKWGSEDINVLVGSHTDTEKAVVELYSSIIEELKKKVDNPKITDEQLTEIAKKIAEKGFYTKTEVDNLISNIQVPTKLSQLADDTEHRTVTDAEKEKWNKPTITVDDELSETSENPVQNKVIINAFHNIGDNIDQALDNLTNHFGSNLNDVKAKLDTKADKTDLDKKADKFTVDMAIDSSSNNPIANSTVTNHVTNLYTLLDNEFKYYAKKTDLDKKADKTALDAKADKFTIDNSVSATSDNPVSSKAVNTSLNALANELGEGIEARLEEKADKTALDNYALKTDLDKKIDKSSIVTEITEENYDEYYKNENPIAVKAVMQFGEGFYDAFYPKKVAIHKQFELVALDTDTLNVITKAWNDVLHYSEFWFVFYGRENNKEDTLEDGNGNDSISVNGVRVIAKPLTYIRKSGTYFYTCGHFKLVGEFIFGTVARCDGNGVNTVTVEPIKAEKVDDIIIKTNNLFKGDSKFGVYAI